MAEQVRIGIDGEPLPIPIDGTQEYLAAILDALWGLRDILSSRALQEKHEAGPITIVVDAPVVEPAVVALPEPDPPIDTPAPTRKTTRRKPKS